MATLYAGSGGTIIRWLANQKEEKQYPNPPDGTVSTLSFDASANKPTANDLTASVLPYTLVGSTLSKNGSPVTINPPSTDSQRQMIDDLVALQATIQAAGSVNQLKSGVQDLRRILLQLTRTVEFPAE